MNDNISRQAAIDALKQQAEEMARWSERYKEQRKGILTAINIVSDLLSAQPSDEYNKGWHDGRESLREEIWEDGRDRLD